MRQARADAAVARREWQRPDDLDVGEATPEQRPAVLDQVELELSDVGSRAARALAICARRKQLKTEENNIGLRTAELCR